MRVEAGVFVGWLASGAALAQGSGLEAGIAAWEDGRLSQAVRLWRPLAESGDARAQLYLAYALRTGQGVVADDGRALRWYREAAVQGIPEAQYELGLMYELGLGVPPDPHEAERWYGQAVGQGFCPGELDAGGRLGDR
jgi:hypothetical protein